MTVELYWEDFVPGQVLELGERTLSQDEIDEFARRCDPRAFGATGERRIPFGSLTAFDFLSSVVWQRMHADALLSRAATWGGPGLEQIRHFRPIRAGERLRGRLAILDTWPSTKRADRGTAYFEGTLVGDEDEPIMSVRGRTYIERRVA